MGNIKKLKNSFKYAIQGIVTAFKAEQNLKIHFLAVIIVILAAIILRFPIWKWIVCVLLFGMVITAELINTAIEITVDIAMPEINEKAKMAKDMAAGAVLISAIVSVIIGILMIVY